MQPDIHRAPESLGVYEAKNRLSELIERVAAGEEFIITRHGQPIVRLVPEHPSEIDVSAVDAIFDELRQLSASFAPDVTIDELRQYIEEGRR